MCRFAQRYSLHPFYVQDDFVHAQRQRVLRPCGHETVTYVYNAQCDSHCHAKVMKSVPSPKAEEAPYA